MNRADHLTEDQIDDYLIGDLAELPAAHLAGCVDCQARVTAMEAPLASFRDVSLAWSERQSATMPMRSPASARPLPRGRRAIWASVAAAAVAIGVAIPFAQHEQKPTAQISHVVSAPSQTFVAEREEQIAQDNQMLRDIDRELGVSVSSPSETFGLELGSNGRRSGHNAPIRD